LLILPNPLNRQNLILLTQEPRIKLIIRDDEEEDNANHNRQQACPQEVDLPAFNGGAMFVHAAGNGVCD